MGRPAVTRVDQEALYPPDLTIDGVDRLPGACFGSYGEFHIRAGFTRGGDAAHLRTADYVARAGL